MAISNLSRLRHDLRTPVNHLLGYSQLLLEDGADGDANDRAWKSRIQQVASLGQEILRTIENCLPATDSSAAERQLPELRSRLHHPVQQIQENLRSITLPADASQIADIQRLFEASSRLLRFAAGGSLAEEQPHEPPADIPSAAGTITGKARLLLVDDDLLNREVLGRMLVRLEYDVHFAASGPEALELIRKHSYDLVLLDIIMPGISGYEVLQNIKISAPNVPVIVISAVGELKTLVDCIEQGAEDYFLKPFEPVLLRARISASLKRTRCASPATQSRSQELHEPEEIAREIKVPIGFVANFTELAADTLAQLQQALGHQEGNVRDLLADLEQSMAAIQRHSTRAMQALKKILDRQGQ
jgi:DNA-binding response OmpR family regulator/ElaB/YqjD/DUF883 family membrane-anchored ribosome-binding protein